MIYVSFVSKNTKYEEVIKKYLIPSLIKWNLPYDIEYIENKGSWRNNVLYIGTRHLDGGNARMFLWNGSGTTHNGAFSVGAEWSYSGEEYQSSMITVTSGGQILWFNGGGFNVLANFPIYYTPIKWTTKATAS
ncbi:hypothetical protein LCGC14_1972810, partial [marine sediment metagenome]